MVLVCAGLGVILDVDVSNSLLSPFLSPLLLSDLERQLLLTVPLTVPLLLSPLLLSDLELAPHAVVAAVCGDTAWNVWWVQVWKVGRFMVGRLDWGGEGGEPRRTIPRISLQAKETYRKVCVCVCVLLHLFAMCRWHPNPTHAKHHHPFFPSLALTGLEWGPFWSAVAATLLARLAHVATVALAT